MVDLVITHGGNNTLTESFYYGKPMIVLPLFGDQFDNAQRIHEKGFGIRLKPFKSSQKEFLDAIDKLINDNELKVKMEKIAKRIQNSNSNGNNRPDYSRSHFNEINPQPAAAQGVNAKINEDHFEDLLGGFKRSQNDNSHKSMAQMKKEEMVI